MLRQATGLYCDVWVDLEVGALAIEVENDWGAAIEGTGQALFYAQHNPGRSPS